MYSFTVQCSSKIFLQVDNETITKTSFEYFFRGTELVVAGKIKNSESKFNTTLNANSSDGSFQDSTFFDIPIFPPITLIQKTRHIGNFYFI